MKPVTLRTVAERVGMSVQTVSNAMQGTGRVSAETAERIRQVAVEMGYRPNAGAQALRGKSTKTLSFILNDPVLTSTPSAYLGFLVPLVASAIREMGFRASIQFTDDADLESALLPLRQGLVDGAIVSASTISADTIRSLARQKVPIVLFERWAPDNTVPYVTADSAGGVAQAVRHVHQLGARRIAYVDGRPHWPMTASVARYQGFVDAIGQLGCESLPIVEGDWRFESGVAAFQTLRQRGRLPDAIVCANDQMAVGVLKAAQGAGLLVPDDLSVTGFDDLEFARYTTPELTSIRLPLAEMGRRAVERLASLVGGTIAQSEYASVLPTELVVRASSKGRVRKQMEEENV